MKEFIEKLIARLENRIFSAELYNDEFDGQTVDNIICLGDVADVANQLAEEHSKDKDWKTTRRYLNEKYFSKIRELSAKYNHPCEDIPINFDWVLGLIEKIEKKLAEEYKDINIITDFLQYVRDNADNYDADNGWDLSDLIDLSIKFCDAEEHNNGWIPYTTGCKMPNEASRVWLSFTTPVASFVKSAWYINGHFEWDNCRRVKETPMAWKPYNVPEPYQPKGE